jgi:cbb3-type cytochrome oxidase subunit 3
MIQIIAAIAVAVWFFRSANKIGKSGIRWAIIGVCAFILPDVPWAMFAYQAILPAVIKSDIGETGVIISALVIALFGLLLGFVVAFWVHRKYLKSNVQQSTQEQ